MPALILPMLGTEKETATVLKWYRKEGDRVGIGDVICQVETAKAAFDIDAEVEGVIVARRVPEGGKVESLHPLAWIGEPGEEPDWESAMPPEETAAPQPVEKEAELPPNVHVSREREGAVPDGGPASVPAAPQAHSSRERERAVPEGDSAVRASPSARAMARKLGVKLEDVARAFPGKLLTEQDVEKYAEEKGR